MSLTLSGQWLRLNARHTALSHRAKVTQQFPRQNTLDFTAASEWASYSPDLNPLDYSDYCIWDILQDLVYEGRRHPFANQYRTLKRQSKQMEGHHWDRSKIHCTMKKRFVWLKSRMEARFSTFTANRCDWITISCSDSVELIGYFVRFRHPILFCVFHFQNKSA